MKFKKEELTEIVWDCDPDYLVVSEKVVGDSRWEDHVETVFKSGDRFFVANWRRGKTEMQETRPFEYDPDEIECPEVFPVEKTITVYKRAPK